MRDFLSLINTIRFTDILDIILVSLLFMYFFWLIRETRSPVALRGVMTIFIFSLIIYFLARLLNLRTILLIFQWFWLIIILGFAILFQNALRRALTQLGQLRFMRHFFPEKGEYLDDIVRAINSMSNRKTGALVAIERNDSLRHYIDTGVPLDSIVSQEMLRTVFTPYSPLHDGAVIIENNRIVAAGCILPLTEDPTLNKDLGTRHRAGIGLSEETDAFVIMVSEETGMISVAINGKLTRGHTPERLRKMLENLLVEGKKA